MFIGHMGAAFGAKKFAPSAPLGILIFAAMFSDFLWNVLVLLGVEHFRLSPGITQFNPFDLYYYPFSHSLLANIIFSAAAAGAYYLYREDVKSSVVVGLCVLSHWVLDWISHMPDLPLYPGSHHLSGLGLWFNFNASVFVELAIFVCGIVLYRDTAKPTDKIGKYGFWAMAGTLFVMWSASILSFPPSNTSILAITGILFIMVFVPAGNYINSHTVYQ